MAYATLAHLQAHCPARTFGASTLPSLDQAVILLEQTAGRIDGALVAAGYQLPVPAGATSALKALERVNAIGAWYEVEAGAPQSNDVDRAWKAWEAALNEIDPARRGPTIELDIPRNVGEAYARGKTLEEAGLASSGNTFFSPDMEL